MRRLLLVLGLVTFVAGCAAASKPNVPSVLNNPGGVGIPLTTECVAKDPDRNRCNKATCKADAESDCTVFAIGCLDDPDGYFQGTKDAGTCSRIL